MFLARINGHTFFSRFIHSEASVVDLGANAGNFSKKMIEHFGCHCYAVEANPDVYALIPSSDHLTKFNFAVSNKSDMLKFHIAENTEMSSLYVAEGAVSGTEITVSAKRLDDFLAELKITSLDLLKIDVEGAEIDILDSCSDDFLKTIRQITVEFHDFNGMVSRPDVFRTTHRLKTLGFSCIVMTRPSFGHEDVCFINRKHCSISLLELLWAGHIVRNVKGLMRLIQRGRKKLRNTIDLLHKCQSSSSWL